MDAAFMGNKSLFTVARKIINIKTHNRTSNGGRKYLPYFSAWHRNFMVNFVESLKKYTII